MQQTIGWRIDAQPGPRPVLRAGGKNLPDLDSRTVREAEFGCNSLIGFNFGDGHLHNEDLVEHGDPRSGCRLCPGRVGRGVMKSSRSTRRSSVTR